MSGIYIPDMAMPKNCFECPLAADYFKTTFSNGGKPFSYACVLTKKTLTSTKRNRACPLVAVPDHGRLIDVGRPIKEIEDAIENIDRDFPLLDFNSRYCMERGLRMAKIFLNNAPTIAGEEPPKMDEDEDDNGQTT